MTLDPSEWIDKATEFVKEAGRQAEAVAKKVAAGPVGDAVGGGVADVAKKAPAKRVDPKHAEAAADKAEAAAERAREQGELAARTARTEADLRAKRAASEAREQADELREQGEEIAKGLDNAAEAMRKAPGGDAAAAALESNAKTVRAETKKQADAIEKAGDAAYQRAIDDGEIAAKAAEKAADEKAMEYEAVADDAREDAAAARTSTRMHAETRKRAESERDRPEISKEREVDLDVDDAGTVRADATAARATARENYETEAVRLTKARDEAAREQWSQEQDAKAAQMQVKREQKVVEEARATAERLNREADTAREKGDHALADSLRENAQRAASDQRVAEARLESAHAEADRGLTSSQEAKAQVEALEKEFKDLQAHRDQAEKAVDGLEERARLLEEAQKKFDQADKAGNEKLRQEAEALVEQAEKVHVDRTVLASAQPGGEEGPVTTPGADEGPVTTPGATTDGPQQAPPAQSTSGEPTAAELRALTEKYGNAAQALHKRRLDAARTVDPDDHRRAVSRELTVVDAQLKKEIAARDATKAKVEEYRQEAANLEREATRLDRQGKSTVAEEKREDAELAAARAERTATMQKDAETQVATLQARKEELDKQWKEEIDQHLGDPKGAELEKTADQMDDAARAMGDAYRARLDADDLRVRAEQAGNDGKPELKAQLEQQARDAVAKSNELLAKARQTAPADEASQQALEDAGVPSQPAESTDGQPAPAGEPTAAELREMVEKYADAAQSVHSRRWDDVRISDADDKADSDARFELSGAKAQQASIESAREVFTAQVAENLQKAEQLELEATQLFRQGKSKESEEKQEEAELAKAKADGRTAELKNLDTREAELKSRIETLGKQIAQEAERKAGRAENLERTADQLDDVARTMGEAYRARLDADELLARAATAAPGDAKAQLEQQSREAATRSTQLVEQARQAIPRNDVAGQALKDAGVVDTLPPPGPTPDPPVDTSQTEVSGTTESTTTQTASEDLVGDEGLPDEQPTTGTVASGDAGDGSGMNPDESSADGVPAPDQRAAFAPAESDGDVNASVPTTEAQEAEGFDGQDSPFADEQVVAAAPPAAPAEEEFVDTADDGSSLT